MGFSSTPRPGAPLTLFLFGDQAYTIPKRELQRLLDDEAFQSSPPIPLSPLSLFIHRCETALLQDVAQLINPADASRLCSGTLADLLRQWRFRSDGSSQPHHSDHDNTRRCLPLDTALLVAYQVLLFMRHIGSSSSSSATAYADYRDAAVVGACTGALAAAAVACSAGLAELVPLGVEAVRAAFRVGLVVERAAREAAPATGTKEPWSMVVSAADKQTLRGLVALVERRTTYGQGKSSKYKGRCWVSARSPSSVTVSGLPEVLAELAGSDEMAKPGVRKVPMPIFGPFHNPSLHKEEDVAGVLASLDLGLGNKPARLMVISSSTGKPPDQAGNFSSLMRIAVEDMLLRPLRWDLVLQQLCDHAETDERGSVLLDVVPIASSADQTVNAVMGKECKGMRRPRPLKSHSLVSTTIHRVVTEIDLMMGDGLYLVTEADLARPDLREAVQGHLVEGKRLCTPSVFADIAMTVGKYLLQKLLSQDGQLPLAEKNGKVNCTSGDQCLVTVANLGVSKALVVGDDGPESQLLQCHVHADWSTRSARCKFVVASRSGRVQQHAECTLHITDASVRDLLSQYSSGESYQANVSSLRSRPGTTQIPGGTAYRLVSSLADFHRNHRLVRSLVFDPRTHEMAAVVGFPADLSGRDEFTAHPAVIDAFTQPAGFCLNLDDANDLAHTVYVNHGWEDMFLFEAIDMAQEYTVYVCMRQVGRTRTWTGDIVVLRENTVVAAFLQYSVKAFPRRVFSSLLTKETSSVPERARPTAAPETPRTAVPWSPLGTPRPRMALSIDTKGAERAGQAVFPLSPVSPDDLSRQEGSASSNDLDRPDIIPVPPCKSIVLQGSAHTARTLLFLLPDGSGNAASYASLPLVGPDVCVVGLVCPFLRGDTAAMARVPLDRLLSEGYLPEIFRRQPPSSHNKYLLGGWSAGGSLAFRAAQMLSDRGCRVAELVLIDAPAPVNGMDRLPRHFYDYCERLGIFGGWGGGKVPNWLIPHFEATIGVLARYCATPLVVPPGEEPRVDIIWAGESVVDRPGAPPLPPHADDTEGMKFLTVRRSNFGPDKWAELLPGAEIVCHRVEGAHHFSLTREPFVSQLGAFIAEGLNAVQGAGARRRWARHDQ